MTGYAEFVQKYPAYDKTHDLDELRQRDYARLDRLGQVYLDYTGGGLYADSQIRAHQAAAGGEHLWQPAFLQSQLAQPPPGLLEAPGRKCSGSSRPTRTSTRSSSPKMPAGRSNWWAKPIPSVRAAITC